MKTKIFIGLFLILCYLISCLYSQNTNLSVKDSTFHQHHVRFKFPISKGWEVDIIEIKGGDISKDSTYVTEVDHFKIGVSPSSNFHVFVTIIPNESKLNTSFEKFVSLTIKEYKRDLTILDTSIFKHKGLEAFEIITRWQNLGSSIYSFNRTWYIHKGEYMSRISFECDETTYSKFFSTAIKIMKSVVFD